MSSTNMSGNATTGKPLPEGGCFESDQIAIKAVRILAYSFVMIVSLIGNLLVIAVVLKNRRMRTTVNLFIVNMAVADLVVTLYIPRAMTVAYAGYEWQVGGTLGAVLCRMSILFNQVPMIASVLTVVAISFDRFAAVLYPLKPRMSTRSCKVVIVLTWFIALAVRLPTVAAVSLRHEGGKLYCYLLLDETYGEGTRQVFYHFTFVAIFCVPFVLIVFLYSAIICTLKRGKPLGSQMDSVNSQDRIQRRRQTVNKKVLRMISAVVVSFWICWFLYYIYLILFAYEVKISCELIFIRLFLANFNTALNPCLYVKFSENYRRGFRKVITGFFGYCKCSQHQEKMPPLQQRRRSTGWDSDGSMAIKIAGEVREMSEIQAH